MRQINRQRSRLIRGAAIALGLLLTPETMGQSIAQSVSSCQPPRANEYLLLVRNQKPDTRSQLQAILPANAVLTVCDYLSNNVVRVESFASADVANAWAQYLNDIAGLQAFVARPNGVASTPAAGGTSSPAAQGIAPTPAAGGTSSPVAQADPTSFPSPTLPAAQPSAPAVSPAPSPAPSPASAPLPVLQPAAPTVPTAPAPTAPAASTAPAIPPTQPSAQPAPAAPTQPPPAATASPEPSGFSPRPLGTGYAVLVNYFNRPEVAADVHQVTAQQVGLVAFEQRPYLLAVYTTDATVASSVLKSLSARGLTAAIVDSRQVMLLTTAVTGAN